MSDPRYADLPESLTEVPTPRRRLRSLAIPAAVVAVMGIGGATAAALPTMLDQGAKSAAVAQPVSQVLQRSETPTPTPTPTSTPTPTPTPKPAAPAPAKPAPKKPAPRAEVGEVIGSRFADTRLNVRSEPSESAAKVTTLDEGQKVAITDERSGEWRQVKVGEKVGWTLADHLDKDRPAPAEEVTAGSGSSTAKAKAKAEKSDSSVSSGRCSDGSAVERGLQPNAIKVHRAVCAKWSGLEYGGLRAGDSGSEHATGHALDIMVRGSKGDEIAAWLKANASRLGITELIWEQRIWTTQRSSEGWRGMSDRGGATANHFDHVHVSVR